MPLHIILFLARFVLAAGIAIAITCGVLLLMAPAPATPVASQPLPAVQVMEPDVEVIELGGCYVYVQGDALLMINCKKGKDV